MDNKEFAGVTVVNGTVTGVHLGTPMQDATPDNAEDNNQYYVERNQNTRAKNYEDILDDEPTGSLDQLSEEVSKLSEEIANMGGSSESTSLVVTFVFDESGTITSSMSKSEINAAAESGVKIVGAIDGGEGTEYSAFANSLASYPVFGWFIPSVLTDDAGVTEMIVQTIVYNGGWKVYANTFSLAALG